MTSSNRLCSGLVTWALDFFSGPPPNFLSKSFSQRNHTMDPYDFSQSSSSSDHIQDDFQNDEDTLKELEKELAPKPLDFYGILNVSKTVSVLAPVVLACFHKDAKTLYAFSNDG